MGREPAVLTPKGGLALTISTLAMPAAQTRLRGVGRVDQPDLDSSPGRLVGEKYTQLKEGPGMPLVSLFAPNHCLFSNAGQVFESQCLARDDGFPYQSLADGMVDVFHIPAFPPAHLLETPFGRTSSHPLQSGTAGDEAAAFRPHLRPRKLLALAISGDVDHAQIDADGLFRRGHSGSLLALRDMQEVRPVAPDHLGTADLPLGVAQHLVLALRRPQTRRDAPFKRIERHTIKGQQAVGAGVVADAGAGAELRAPGGFGRWHGLLALALPPGIGFAPAGQLLGLLSSDALDGFHRLRTGANRQLRAQPEAGAGLSIDAVMRCYQQTIATQEAASLKRRCVSARAASWPVASSLMQIVLVSVSFIRTV